VLADDLNASVIGNDTSVASADESFGCPFDNAIITAVINLIFGRNLKRVKITVRAMLSMPIKSEIAYVFTVIYAFDIDAG
jgi:hypothetical protein